MKPYDTPWDHAWAAWRERQRAQRNMWAVTLALVAFDVLAAAMGW